MSQTLETLTPVPHDPVRPVQNKARIVGQAHVVPGAMSQEALWVERYSEEFHGHELAAKIWASSGIETRHGVANPAFEDLTSWSTGQRMERYQREALPLGITAVKEAIDQAGIAPGDVGMIAVVSCTGYATPGLDIKIAEALGMSNEVQRLVIGHMGCYAAIPGLGAVSDYVVARQKPAVMLCIELTSLHQQPVSEAVRTGRDVTEEDVEQLVAHAIFADAAAAVVLAPTPDGDPWFNDELSLPGFGGGLPALSSFEVVDICALTDASTQNLMRWDVTDLGFRMRLSLKVPSVLGQHVCTVVDGQLGKFGYTREDVAGWAVHPGGRKILEVVNDRLELPAEALRSSYRVLRNYGNCSSPTVLLVLEDLARTGDIPVGAPVIAMAFGPGLTLYSALLRRV